MQPSTPYPPAQQPPPQTPAYPAQNPPQPNGQAPGNDYSFIMDPGATHKTKLTITGGSLRSRILVILGGLVILLVAFIVLKNVLSGSGSNGGALLGVVQSQQELIHLATQAAQQQGLSTTNVNFTATVQASVLSSQQAMASYITSIGQKMKPAQVNLKVSASVDTVLSSSAAAGTYDQTYQSVMQTQLNSYEQALKQAYSLTTGARGRALLSNDYKQAQLLLVQLNSSTS